MPEEVRNLCRLADISSKSLLLQVVRQDTPEKMTALIEKIAGQGGATRQQLREAAAKPKAGRPKHFVFAFRPPTKAVQSQTQLQQEPRVARRNHRRARSDHQGPARQEVTSRGASGGVAETDRASRQRASPAASAHRSSSSSIERSAALERPAFIGAPAPIIELRSSRTASTPARRLRPRSARTIAVTSEFLPLSDDAERLRRGARRLTNNCPDGIAGRISTLLKPAAEPSRNSAAAARETSDPARAGRSAARPQSRADPRQGAEAARCREANFDAPRRLIEKFNPDPAASWERVSVLGSLELRSAKRMKIRPAGSRSYDP